MQPNDERDAWNELLEADYRVPELDAQFSSHLLYRLQAEVGGPKTTPRNRRSRIPLVCSGIAIAGSVVVGCWLANWPSREGGHEVAVQSTEGADSDSFATKLHRVEERTGDAEPGVALSEVDDFPASVFEATVIEERQRGSSMPLDNVDTSNSETKFEGLSLARVDSLQTVLSQRGGPEQRIVLNQRSVLAEEREPEIESARRRTVSARVTVEGKSYLIENGGRLVELNPTDNSRRFVGEHDWRGSVAIGVADGELLIVGGDQLYRVNRASGVRRGLGKPEWDETKTKLTVGGEWFTVRGDILHPLNSKVEEE